MTDAFHEMDAMYRYQRSIYDITRKFYLLGRDQLLDRINISAGQTVAEIGCGTGRNLEILARRYPENRFFGLDASAEMLRTASAKIDRVGIENVTFQPALAQEFDHNETFGLAEPFDVIFFSYSISMIPPWRESIERAMANLRPGGTMYIVDFYDQCDLPKWFGIVLRGWLKKFHVQFWPELIPYLKQLDHDGAGQMDLIPVARRYAFIADFQKAA